MDRRLDEDSPRLRDYLELLKRRRLSILTISALVVVSALFFYFSQEPIYRAQASVLVIPISTATGTSSGELTADLATERSVATSYQVARLAGRRLSTSEPAADLLDGLTAEALGGSSVLELNYEDEDPGDARAGAQAFADAYLADRQRRAREVLRGSVDAVQQRLEELDEALRQAGDQATSRQLELLRQRALPRIASDVRVGEIIGPALTPGSAVNRRPFLIGGLALFAGLALGVVVAVLREALDERLRGRDELETYAGVSTLAVIPRFSTRRRNQEQDALVAVHHPESEAAEAYRTLRTRFLFSAAQQDIRTLLVTSPEEGEGKTTVAANLGAALADAGYKVVLVSADLKRPRLHLLFGVPGSPGLANVLLAERRLDEVLVRANVPSVTLLPSGPSPPTPVELLGSYNMVLVLEELSPLADFVIVDSRALLGAADATVLSGLVDAVLVVADARRTTRGAIERAASELAEVDARVIGAVLNNHDASRARSSTLAGGHSRSNGRDLVVAPRADQEILPPASR